MFSAAAVSHIEEWGFFFFIYHLHLCNFGKFVIFSIYRNRLIFDFLT